MNGMAPPSEVVGLSIAGRWSLISACALGMVIQICTRQTTKMRDRFLYNMFHCGRKNLPADFFENAQVNGFLERDMLLFEALFDTTAITVLQFFVFVIELRLGTDGRLAFGSAAINWGIQMVFEQAGNVVVFYLRQRKRPVFSRSSGGGQPSTVGTATTTAVTKESASLYRTVVVPSVQTVWQAVVVTFTAAYVGYLLIGYATMCVLRNLAVYYDSADEFVYEAP